MLICCILLAALRYSFASVSSPCQYTKQQGYQTADCYDRRLTEVPKNLRPEVEVVDLSFNRIEILKNDSFACCKSIKLLYLQQNILWGIESHAFFHLTSLTVLDLSNNVLDNFPENLPASLQKLYMDHNLKLFNPPMVPIAYLAALEALHLSSNELTRFPIFNGRVASLIVLNITNNPLTEISVDDVAPLCQLRYLYVNSNGNQLFPHIQWNDTMYCKCKKFEKWTTDNHIEVRSFSCRRDKPPSVACKLDFSNSTIASYNSCLAEVNSRKLPYKMMIGGGIVALIVGIIILFYLRRRRKRQIAKCENAKNRTPANLKNIDNKTMEEKCTNHAFDGRPYRIQHVNMPPTETAV